MTKRACIIGLGSPFGADQFGWLVIERLQQNHALQSFLDEHIELISADRPGVNLIHLINNKSNVILIDAIADCPDIGKILRLDKQQLLQQEHRLSSHSLGVADSLALGDKLGQLPEQLVLLGMCVDPEVAEIDAGWIKEMEKVIIEEISL